MKRLAVILFSILTFAIASFHIVAASVPTFHAVSFNEIAWAGTSTSASDEWIELSNFTDTPISLDGWRIVSSDGSPDILLEGTIPAFGHFLLERTNDDSAPSTADQIYTGSLSNTGERLTLFLPDGQEMDVAGDPDSPWFAGDNVSKRTMERVSPHVEGNVSSSWIDGEINGTPTNSIVDVDNDEYGYSPNIDWAAGDGVGFEQLAEDCDDTRNDVYPDAIEVLDVRDNDCDVEVDEGFTLGLLEYELYFNSDNLYAMAPTTNTNALELALLGLINSAESTIDAAIYGFSRVSIRDALIAAHQRGVEVRIAADYSEYHGSRSWPFDNHSHNFLAAFAERDINGSRTPQFFHDLETAGITIYPSNYVSYLQHNKFLIIDGATVWTGSTNLTDTGFSINMNNALVLKSEYVALAYQIEFDEMVSGKFATAKEDNTPHKFQFDNAFVEIYFSPSDEVESKIVDVMSAAQTNMHFSMFFWTSDVLGDLAVSKYVTEGLRIEGVWDAVGARNAFSEDQKMCDAGIPLKIEIAGGKAHNKFAVFDHAGINPTVVTGSYNWTASGAESNDENIVIISGNTAIAQRYYEEVMYVYNALPDETICGNISAESGIAACSNGRDDDFDFQIDEADSNCAESTVATCTDGIDNDGDDDVDSADLDCWMYYHGTPTNIELIKQASVVEQVDRLLNWMLLSLVVMTSFVIRQDRADRKRTN